MFSEGWINDSGREISGFLMRVSMSTRFRFLGFAAILCVSLGASCATAVYPGAIAVRENPQTGERVRFFPENRFKVPADYDEAAHLAEWNARVTERGFTRPIEPEADAERLERDRVEARRRAEQLQQEGVSR